MNLPPFTPDEYHAHLMQYNAARREERALSYTNRAHRARKDALKAALAGLIATYRARIPDYLLARCPFCDGTIHEPIDTYSLNGPGWRGRPDGFGWYPAGTTYRATCAHAVMAAYGVNLNGITPDDVTHTVEIGSERPFVQPPLLTRGRCTAVMHTLPVNRMDNTTQQYTLYLVSYFTTDHTAFNNVTRPYHAGYTLVVGGWEPDTLDLQRWVEEGKLCWLDRDNPALPLRTGPVKDFPYGSMGGRTGRWAIQQGKLKLIMGPRGQ